MSAAFAKFRVGTPEAGSSHASYITRALNRDQIAELRAYAETLPYTAAFRKEFREAANMAEQRLQWSEAEAAREAQQELIGRGTTEQLRPDTTIRTDRSDRDCYSRGRWRAWPE